MLLLAGMFLATLGVQQPLQAQALPGDEMTFPREVLSWFFAGDAQRVWQHAGPTMRELAGSAEGLREDAAEISASLGAETGVFGEQLFEHPEGGGAQVYVRALRHAHVPEIFWIVIFSPAERQVQVIMAQPRQTIRTLFPQVRLP